MQGCGQIRETKRQLFRANATLSEVNQLIINFYFKFIIYSKFWLHKWSLNQCY